MADEIQIKPVGSDPQDTQGAAAPVNNQSATAQSSQGDQNSQAGSSQTGQTGNANTTQPAVANPVSSTQPVAGSSDLTITPLASQSTTQTSTTQTVADQTSTQTPATAQPPVVPPAVSQQPEETASQAALQTTPVQKKGFNLADELEEENSNQAPPEKYAIPSVVKEKFPDLVDLIKSTESMSDDEREYWFQILPIMTEEQITKFRDILVNEKEQLAKLDSEYEDELNRLNEKHMIEWKEFESKEKRRALTEAEQQAATNEKQTEEDLLAKLNQI